jgi:hypothetical protein
MAHQPRWLTTAADSHEALSYFQIRTVSEFQQDLCRI